jgi:hypothetical protein
MMIRELLRDKRSDSCFMTKSYIVILFVPKIATLNQTSGLDKLHFLHFILLLNHE